MFAGTFYSALQMLMIIARLQNSDLIPTCFSFETTLSSISGEDKEMFIELVKKMIRWQPNERSTAKELLKDPWFNTGLSLA